MSGGSSLERNIEFGQPAESFILLASAEPQSRRFHSQGVAESFVGPLSESEILRLLLFQATFAVALCSLLSVGSRSHRPRPAGVEQGAVRDCGCVETGH